MGITIHFGIEAKAKDTAKAYDLVKRMHDLARSIPFDAVGEIVHHVRDNKPAATWDGEKLYESGDRAVRLPWSKKYGHTVDVAPLESITVVVAPADGSEDFSVGLDRYPATVEAMYDPTQDDRFIRLARHGDRKVPEFNWPKWDRHTARLQEDNNDYRSYSPRDYRERRVVKTGMAGTWAHGDFCKTIYAGDPERGGLPNFLAAHVATIALLDRIATLPGVAVGIDDEGRYGPSNYSDDWAEARAAGREPTYVDHPATYDVAVLGRQLLDADAARDTLIATLQDIAHDEGMEDLGPHTTYRKLAALRLDGADNVFLDPFLKIMRRAAERQRQFAASSTADAGHATPA